MFINDYFGGCCIASDYRREELDIARGLGMVMVILGHTISFPLIRGVIFSFHMPLFFIISGFNYRYSRTKTELKQRTIKSFKRLMIPAFGLYFIKTAVYMAFGKIDLRARDILLTILYGGGVKYASPFGLVPAIGLVWFLVCLFWCRLICDLIHLEAGDKGCLIVAAALSCLGVFIGRSVWMLQDFDVSFAVTVFFFAGKLIDEKRIVERISSKPIYPAACILLAGGGMLLEYCFTHDYLELAIRSYPLFPLCYIIAIFLSLCVIIVSRWISVKRIRYVSDVLSTIGKESLLLFSLHYLDSMWHFLWDVKLSDVLASQLCSSLLRLIVDLTAFYFTLFVFKIIKVLDRKSEMD